MSVRGLISTISPGGAAAALLGLAFALGAIFGARADEHEIAGTAAVVFGPGAFSSAVYPRQELPIRYSHAQHLALGIGCDRCHTGAATSTSSADFLFPKGASCDGCHTAQHPRPAGVKAQCELCHAGAKGEAVTAKLVAPRPRLIFNHRLHMSRGASCEGCHGDMTKVRLATTSQLPSEASCLSCHDGAQATQRCGACHPSESSGRLAIRDWADRAAPMLVPKGTSAWGAAHDLAFVEDHRGIAKANPSLCASCHSEASCAECHAGAIRPMRIHAADYMTTHALDSRAKTQDCSSCHRAQTDCLACHERVGLGAGPDRRFGPGTSLRFHPESFVGPLGSAQGHAMAAQRNLAACASCHTEDTCLACHTSAGLGRGGMSVSPHGAGFTSSARCQALASRNHRVCLKCHVPGDPRNECM
ncbi:MAG: cytochrome C [Nannocystis sp.]|nr:cytochrome C [Nannocystis sp.]